MKIEPTAKRVTLETQFEAPLDQLFIEAVPSDVPEGFAGMVSTEPVVHALREVGSPFGETRALCIGVLVIYMFVVEQPDPSSPEVALRLDTLQMYQQNGDQRWNPADHSWAFDTLQVWWGDGTQDDITDFSVNPAHTYAASGVYDVRVRLLLSSGFPGEWSYHPTATGRFTVS